ncbi:hypothetical protein TWF481_002737 [Arthrobotrys musiformis]|uniref:Uncharacterized protein n=1 Tax=Arthrobotrys musiformis TaxID=47236 RepID=A0AAV9VT81_9PEZI
MQPLWKDERAWVMAFPVLLKYGRDGERITVKNSMEDPDTRSLGNNICDATIILDTQSKGESAVYVSNKKFEEELFPTYFDTPEVDALTAHFELFDLLFDRSNGSDSSDSISASSTSSFLLRAACEYKILKSESGSLNRYYDRTKIYNRYALFAL